MFIQITSVGISKLKIPGEHTATYAGIIPEKPADCPDTSSQGDMEIIW